MYKATDVLARALNVHTTARAELLEAAPKILQGIIAAVGDFYTWKLAQGVYGQRSKTSWVALVLTVLSPWQWFCSTRTLTNCLETTLTIVALYNWPWHWSTSNEEGGHYQVDTRGLRVRDAESPGQGNVDETTRLRRALIFAAIATILRPTNILIWLTISSFTFLPPLRSIFQSVSSFSFQANAQERLAFLSEAVLCGTTILALSAVLDRLFYDTWTFPPLNFLYFNVVQSLAIFYGNNDWHYYITQGYPLTLTTALPFALTGIYRAVKADSLHVNLRPAARKTLYGLAITSIVLPAALSILSHKEVRFIYPILPALHVLAAQPLATFFGRAIFSHATHPRLAPPYRLIKRCLVAVILSINLAIALYTTTTHNSGLIDITRYLRHEFEAHYLSLPSPANMTVGMLMPCHSTPWRSHLQYPPSSSHSGIASWALTCEPPLHLNASQKTAYLDEADIFYASPSTWLKKNMSRHLPTHAPGVFAPARPGRMFEVETGVGQSYRTKSSRRYWPDYLVFFQQLEPLLQTTLRDSGYKQCNRIFNSHWHDDWRRTGDIIVWCLYPDRRVGSNSRETSLFGRVKEICGLGHKATLETIKKHIHSPALHHEHTVDTGTSNQRIFKSKPDLARARRNVGSKDKSDRAGGGQGVRDVKTGAQMPVERVVEKPFWKQRPPEETEKGELERKWWQRIPMFGV